MYYDKRKRIWRVRLPAGSQPKTRSFENEREARLFDAQLKAGVAVTTPAERDRPTFAHVAKRWLREYCKVEKRETQWACCERQIDLHLLPTFGTVKIEDLRRSHLLTVKAEMIEKTAHGKKHLLSPRTINNALGLAKSIMTWAVDMEIAKVNPFVAVKPLKLQVREFEWWSTADLATYLARGAELKFDPERLRLVEVAAHTGLRAGELAALKRARLDYSRRKIMVAASYGFKIGKTMPTKNGRIEEVPMNASVFAALEPKRFLQPDAPVFDPALFRELCHWFKRSAEAAGVKPIRFHDLRHSFASNLAAAGIDAGVLSKLMRHRSPQMTQRYVHLHPDHLARATELLCGTPSAHGIEREGKSGAAIRT